MSAAKEPRLQPIDLLALGIAVAVFLALFAVPMQLEANSDATEYLAFADAIRTGEILVRATERPLPRALGTRTPGYPALVAMAGLAWPSSIAAVRSLHVLLGLLGLLYVPIALRREAPIWLSAASVLFVQWRMQLYFTTALTEWTCFTLLLVLFAACVRAIEDPSSMRLALVGFLCAFLILVRPAMVIVAPVPVALVLAQHRSQRIRALAVAAAPFALILLWAGFNLHRIGSFTLTPFSGMNVFGVATMIGAAEPRTGDTPELATLIREVNARKLSRTVRSPGPQTVSLDSAKIYNWNVHQVGEAIRREQGWDWVVYDRLLLTYAWRAIRGSPGAYFAYVQTEIAKLGASLPLLVPALALALYWLRAGRHVGLAMGLLIMAGLHVLHLVLCSLIEVVIPRYESLTYEVLLAAALIATGAGLRGFRRATPSLHR